MLGVGLEGYALAFRLLGALGVQVTAQGIRFIMFIGYGVYRFRVSKVQVGVTGLRA